jgi:nicotinamidase-related amidase
VCQWFRQHLHRATVRFAIEFGHDVTVVKDAMADYPDEEMHAALKINTRATPVCHCDHK